MPIVRIGRTYSATGGSHVRIDAGRDGSLAVLSVEGGRFLTRIERDGTEQLLLATPTRSDPRFAQRFETLADGRYVASYNGGGGEVVVQIFNRDGSEATPLLAQGNDGQGPAQSPSIFPDFVLAPTSDGGFAVAFDDISRNGDRLPITFPRDINGQTSGEVLANQDVRVRFHDATGARTAPSTIADDDVESVNGVTVSRRAGPQFINDAETLANGATVIVFEDIRHVGYREGGSYSREYVLSAQITRPGDVGEPFQVDLGTFGEIIGDYPNAIDRFTQANVVPLPDGGFAVLWNERKYEPAPVFGGYAFTGTSSHVRYYSADGTALTGAIQFAFRGTELGNISNVLHAEALSDGRIAVAYNVGQDGVNGNGRIDATLTLIGVLGASIETSRANPAASVNGQRYEVFDLAVRSDDTIELVYNDASLRPDGSGNNNNLPVIERFAVQDPGEVVQGGTAGEDAYVGGESGDLLFGAAGNDRLSGAGGDDILHGGSGDDALRGGEGADQLFGGEGADDARGGGGNDRISGGAGNDRLGGNDGDDAVAGGDGDDGLFGDAGNDRLGGGADNDYLAGGIGNDGLFGDGGNDFFSAGAGDDYLSGGLGNDSLHGDEGNDFVAAEQGDDYVDGGSGNDQLHGGAGSDRIGGQDGDDYLDGGDGNDGLFGDNGNDTIRGGLLNDYVSGGAGNDTLYGDEGDDFLAGEGEDDYLDGGTGNDQLHGGAGNDRLGGQDGDDYLDGGDGADGVFGDAGSDTMRGGRDNDYLSGGSGGDTLYGDEGDDFLAGEDGDDYLDGSAGADALHGGAGADVLIGDAGNDYLDAGEGNDTLLGGDGADNLIGGAGDDIILGGAGADTLLGEGGADIFRYAAVEDSVAGASDTIREFEHLTDKIDLGQIDANSLADGNQGFTLIGDAAFTGSGAASAGQLRVFQVPGSVGNIWQVEGDTDGDGDADIVLQVDMTDGSPLTGADFIL